MSDLDIIGEVAVAALAVGGSFTLINRVYPESEAWLSFVAAMTVMALIMLLGTIDLGDF